MDEINQGLAILHNLRSVSLTDLLLAYFIYLNHRESKIFQEILITNEKINLKLETIIVYREAVKSKTSKILTK